MDGSFHWVWEMFLKIYCILMGLMSERGWKTCIALECTDYPFSFASFYDTTLLVGIVGEMHCWGWLVKGIYWKC